MRPKTYKTNRAPPKRVGSQYERYPLPFFNAKAHSTWHIEPIGDFKTDRETGRRYAIEFLQSCDGTVGWVTLLPQIVSDMVCAGASGTYADGHPKVNNVVMGFMAVIGRATCMLCMMTTPAEIAVLMEDR
jgi:hypothetical protein